MSDSGFEARLHARIRHALDSEMGPDPIWAESPAARRTWAFRRKSRWPIRLLAVAALLAIGGAALTQFGSRLPRPFQPPNPTPTAVVEAPVIPEVLRGAFMAQVSGFPGGPVGYPSYFIDLEDAVLVHGPGTSDDPAEIRAEDGTALEWAGRIVQFTSAIAGSATVVIDAPDPCGEGRYLLRYDAASRARDAGPWDLTFTPLQDSCADRLFVLVGPPDGSSRAPTAAPVPGVQPGTGTTSRTWTHKPTLLHPGQQYASWSFTEPFHFAAPPPPTFPQVSVWTWLGAGRLRFGNVWWQGVFLDDVTLPLDECNPGAGSLPDIPSTREAFQSWLASNGRTIEETAELEVDSRTAVRYATSETNCPNQAAGTFDSHWYLIPTGDDTILFNVYGDTETEYQVADDIVRSMSFD